MSSEKTISCRDTWGLCPLKWKLDCELRHKNWTEEKQKNLTILLLEGAEIKGARVLVSRLSSGLSISVCLDRFEAFHMCLMPVNTFHWSLCQVCVRLISHTFGCCCAGILTPVIIWRGQHCGSRPTERLCELAVWSEWRKDGWMEFRGRLATENQLWNSRNGGRTGFGIWLQGWLREEKHYLTVGLRPSCSRRVTEKQRSDVLDQTAAHFLWCEHETVSADSRCCLQNHAL